MYSKNFKNPSLNNKTNGNSEVDMPRRRQKSIVGCSFANLESNVDDITCSVSNYNIASNNSYKFLLNVSMGCIKDGDCHSSDTQFFTLG